MLGLYRLLLRLFPKHLRDAYAEEMAVLFERQRNDATDWRRRAWYDGLAMKDVLVEALSARVAEARHGDPRRRPVEPHRTGSLGDDVGHALRALRSSPGFVLVAVLTVAVGIGAACAVYSAVRAVLLQPLPYPEPERLVRVFDTHPGIDEFALAPSNFLDHRESVRSLDAFAVYVRGDAEISFGPAPERVHGMLVSSGFLRVVGIDPFLGRDFTREEERPANRYVAVISARFWEERFDRDPAVVGRKMVVDGVPHTIVGVVPDRLKHVGGRFRSLPYGVTVDVFRPFAFSPDAPRYQHYLNGIARLAPGFSLAEAEAEMNVTAERLEREYPEANRDWRVKLMPLREEIVRDARPALTVLSAAVALLLLVACVNVATLLLVRGAARQHELALRSALGATRRRLFAQLLTESLLVALAGGALGLFFAAATVRVFRGLGEIGMPRLDGAHIDPGVVAFALVATLVTGALFGAVPALRLSRVWASLVRARSGESRDDRRLRGSFVVAELALAIMLLAAAGLLMRSLAHLQREEPGFRAASVLTAKVSLPVARYPESKDSVRLFERLVERFGNVPGVVAAGAGSGLPWSGYDENFGFEPEGRPSDRRGARYHFATPGYFRALGITILRGRTFAPGDDARAPRRVVVNARLARDVWGEDSAVGRRISLTTEPTEEDWWTVIGVVGDVKDVPGDENAKAAIYMPFAQEQWTRELSVVVRAEGDPSSLLDSLRAELAALDEDLPLAEVTLLEEISERAFATPRLLSGLTSSFAALSLGLAALGLYGVVAFNVRRQTRTTAIRMAMGASARDVFAEVLGQSSRLLGLGVVLGLAGALASGRALASVLHGVAPHDPATLVAVTLLLAGAALLASLLPARRACRVDPISILRTE